MMLTTIIRSLYNIKPPLCGGVITIGNFDGVHIGHQQLIAQLVSKAKELSAPSLVVTFEPHPFEFFLGKNCHIPRITRLREKWAALSHCAVNHIIIINFNQQVANITASDFVKLIHRELHPKHIIIGDDFRFGYQRQGDFQLLDRMGQQLGFTTQSIPTVLVDEERVSSTRVRAALMEGKLDLAKRLLNRPYCMLGRIRGGKQLGRQLGFPTANIALHRHLTPITGIYTVYVHGITHDLPWPGVASIGTRPTIGGTQALLEVHLLDFHHTIYGKNVSIEFCKKLRDEMYFPNLNLLKEQIANDVAVARMFFNERK